MVKTGILCDRIYTEHDTGQGHPEQPARILAIEQALQNNGLFARTLRLEPQPAPMKFILMNHAQEYVGRLEELCRTGKSHIDCPDSTICPESFEVARLAAGGVLHAVEQVMTQQINNAFCAVRPPGHHAERSRSMGFCMFNNIAIAAHYLRQQFQLQRILILDWDVHHGNGTQHAFETDPTVFFCSFHGHPETLYPGSGYADERGIGAGEGFTLNIPMWPGADDSDYRRAFEEQFWPAARSFQPEFILISCGFDAHRADPLAHINLETASFAWLTRQILQLAHEFCQGRVVSILEGGYNLDTLAECTIAHVQCLTNEL
ncbi:MAG: hypothetical protein HJJLKODD_02751 [Phycisphaerae bacterium]|nr:hypothetical protein [Phycisphaerae bacterium]